MSEYVVDEVLEPPVAPSTEYWEDIDANEKDYVSELFDNALSDGWKVVYRQDVPDMSHMFLCLNWAMHRFDDDIAPGSKFPDEAPEETTGYSVDSMADFLENRFNLVLCEAQDPDRMAIIWGNNGNRQSVGHIQVKYKERWESKLSEALWVITHGEQDFRHLSGWNLTATGYFKRGE